jgi:hypothetical protein
MASFQTCSLGDSIAKCCYERRYETAKEVDVAIKANIGIGAASRCNDALKLEGYSA